MLVKFAANDKWFKCAMGELEMSRDFKKIAKKASFERNHYFLTTCEKLKRLVSFVKFIFFR